ncbi:MAG: hypothetical protein RJQ14_24975 [Marinoscillum sp.]
MKKLGYLFLILMGLVFTSCYHESDKIIEMPLSTSPSGGGEDDDDPIPPPPPPPSGGVYNGGEDHNK